MDIVGGLVIVNVVLTAALMGLGFEIFFYFKKADMELLKARMFLKRGLIMNMWLYSVSSGCLFVLHGLASFLQYYGYLKFLGDASTLIVVGALTLFLVPFIMLTYSWKCLIKQSVKKQVK